jgi:hypothetical protein
MSNVQDLDEIENIAADMARLLTTAVLNLPVEWLASPEGTTWSVATRSAAVRGALYHIAKATVEA